MNLENFESFPILGDYLKLNLLIMMMGWFKNLFVKQKIDKKELQINELDNWLKNKTEPILERINEKIKKYYFEIKQKQEKINADLVLLNSAVNKEKVNERVLQIVLDNKANYIKQINSFLLKIALPSNFDYRSAATWCLNFEQELDNLAKSSVKSYYKTQHLFSNEVEVIARGIALLDIIFKKLKKELGDNKNIINLIEITYTKIGELEEEISKNGKIQTQLKEEKEEYVRMEERKLALENSLTVLRKSKEYIDLNKLIKEKEGLVTQIKQEKDKFEQPFADLRKALEKFKRMTISDEQLIQSYIFSPIKALKGDPELRIIKVLEQMGRIVEKGQIELKDKKRQKTLKQITTANKEYLDSFLQRYNQLKSNKEIIEEKISANNIIKKEQELNYQLNKIENKLNIYAKLIKEKEERLEKFNINALKEEIKSKLGRITGISISII